MVVMAGVVHQHLQTAYSRLKKNLKQKLVFNQIQSVIPGIGEVFYPFEEALQNSFLLDLFHGATTNIPVRGIV